MRRNVIEFVKHNGRCPQCGGRAKTVRVSSLEDLPKNPPTCVYSKWRRDGVEEDAGTCVRGDRAN